jgi:sugar/nucleoside kinase (ribokinase family)
MPSPKVVIVGHVCIDHNKTEHAHYTNWGSGTLYMGSYARSHLELVPTIATTYGVDFAPYRSAFHLLPEKPQAAQTLVYENIIKDGVRTQYAHHTEVALPPELTAELKQLLATADIVVLATLLPNYTIEYVRQLLESVKPDCLKVCCPQGYFRDIGADDKVSPRDFPEAVELLGLFDLTVLSELDHPRATELAQEWKRAGCASTIVLTQAERGANVLTTSDELQHIPTTPVAEADIVDSVGAGDVFAMALAYDYCASRDITTAVQAAHQAARQKLLTTPQK